MSRDFVGALLQLNAEKQVSREALVRALEEGIQAAYRRVAGEEDIFVRVEPDSGRIDVYRGRYVVDEIEDPMVEVTVDEARQTKDDAKAGDVIEIEQLDGEHFGRIGAQTAKQIILQRIREVERDQVFDQFANREGELLTGSVSRVEPRAIILDVGKGVEAILATSEQSPLEHYRIGQPVKAFVLEVRRSARGPQILVSRTHKGFLKRLFELEVPEIHAGTVEVKAIAREAGSRSKVAVVVAPGGPRPRRRDRRAARRPRAGRGRRARRREDRRDPVERGPVGVRRQRAVAGPGPGREHRHRAPDRERHRARADAVARDRPRGPERATRRPPDRLADRHPERRRRRRGRRPRRRTENGAVRRRTPRRRRWPSTRHPSRCRGAGRRGGRARGARSRRGRRARGAGAEPPSTETRSRRGRSPSPPPGRRRPTARPAAAAPRSRSAPARSRAARRRGGGVVGPAAAGHARPLPPRPTPTRSCIACRTARPKRDLLRVVRAPDGTVAIDPTGRAPGRGAYLCRDASCWDAAAAQAGPRARAAHHHPGRPSRAALAAGPDAHDHHEPHRRRPVAGPNHRY